MSKAPTLTIRTAVPEDSDRLSTLMMASYAMLADSRYDSDVLAAALPLISQANPKLLASGTYFVVESDGEAAGCGGWTMEEPGGGPIRPGIAHIRHFATHPAHTRKGVAKLILERCFAEATAAGARIMHSRSTLPAESFYAAAGFRQIGMIDVKLSSGIVLPAIEMERELP